MESNESSTKYMKSKNSQINLLVNLAKIAIIVMVGVFLIGFFFPFYDYPNDSRGYGLYSMRLFGGEYEFSSELLSSTGKNEFVPASWIKTQNNTAIPDSMPGITFLGAVFYAVGGENGLFYLGPIFAICFLITSERIATKFFGTYVGLLTLCFLATNEIFFWVGRGLLTSNVFSLLFLVGCFYLIKFLQYKENKSIFLATVFLMIPSFFRLNGIIIFPIEIVIVGSYFVISYIRKSKNQISGGILNHNTKKQILKIFALILIPWIIFALFFGAFNWYFFNDPSTSIYTATDNPRITLDLEQENQMISVDLERLKKYTNHFLPYPINRLSELSTTSDDSLNSMYVISELFPSDSSLAQISSNYNLGIITLIVMMGSIIIGFKVKEHKTQLITFSIFIFSFILFYSLSPIAITRQGSGRDILPVLPLFFMMLSYMILKILQFPIKDSYSKNKCMWLRTLKLITFSALILFIPISFYFADYSQIIKNEGWVIKNPGEYQGKFPLDFEGISKESVIFTYYQTWSVIAYGATPFTPSWGDDVDEEYYHSMSQTLKDTIAEGKEVYIMKDPKLIDEKVFYKEFFSSDDFVLKEYSNSFCQIIIKESLKMESDKNCIT